MPLLEIEDLHVEFPTQSGVLHAVEGVSLTLDEGDVLGVVGESGSGKSVSMLALMGLIAWPGRVRARKLGFAGRDVQRLSDRERRTLVGKDVAMIFQEPTTSLNPCFTIGFQLTETLRLHLKLDRNAARRRAIELLEQVGIPAPAARLGDFPHQLSGGMKAQVVFKEQAPWLTIAHAVQLKPVRKEVIDFKLSPFGRHTFYGVDIKE